MGGVKGLAASSGPLVRRLEEDVDGAREAVADAVLMEEVGLVAEEAFPAVHGVEGDAIFGSLVVWSGSSSLSGSGESVAVPSRSSSTSSTISSTAGSRPVSIMGTSSSSSLSSGTPPSSSSSSSSPSSSLLKTIVVRSYDLEVKFLAVHETCACTVQVHHSTVSGDVCCEQPSTFWVIASVAEGNIRDIGVAVQNSLRDIHLATIIPVASCIRALRLRDFFFAKVAQLIVICHVVQ
ncbi:hypothetical protein KC356_g215 [Hortaea werneckii]|nr:hypothetical protein KC356_g215 [Hortaea werneckii]